MPGSQIAHQSEGMAVIPQSNPAKTFLLPFGKNQHLVPESAIVSYPKKANEMPSAEALGALLVTKAPEKWLPYCKPNTLCRIQGETGNCVYTTFTVPGHKDEKRILRCISSTIAEKNFKEILKTEKPPPEGAELRHQIRYDVLGWTKEKCCPSRAQISPEIEKWPVADLTEALKSCAISPETKKRAKPGASQSEEMEKVRKRYVCSEELIQVPQNSTYKINEVGGNLLHVIFYRNAAGEQINGTHEEDDTDDQ
tara:strand:- start:478 stop:1236 length:759 start_codon:yes stop_codon:yes gene_type:complete